ncbi:MAG TPA: hypothetical protein VNO14_03020, partial [Blastocatellia bacterium]|nr:hypothetical protein [Blastocatellia bacterium]
IGATEKAITSASPAAGRICELLRFVLLISLILSIIPESIPELPTAGQPVKNRYPLRMWLNFASILLS